MRILVVGAGIAGLCAGWAFQRVGCDVSIRDLAPIPNPRGGSFDQTRLIHPFPVGDAAAAQRAALSLAAWNVLWADVGVRHQVECGAVAIMPEGHLDARMALRPMEEAGLHGELLTGAGLRERLPGLELPCDTLGICHSGGGLLLADRILNTLQSTLLARGAVFEPGRALKPTELVQAAADFDLVVLAPGARAPALLAEIAPDLAAMFQPVRQVMLYLKPPPALREAWAASAAFIEFGNAREFWGAPPRDGTNLKLAIGALARPVAALDPNDEATPDDIASMLRGIAPNLADVSTYQVIGTRACAYTRGPAPDWTIRRLDISGSNIWFFGGCNGTGFKSAAAAALRFSALARA